MTEFVRFDELSSPSVPEPQYRPVWVNPVTVTTVSALWGGDGLTRICFISGGEIVVSGDHAAVADALADPDPLEAELLPSWAVPVGDLADALVEAARQVEARRHGGETIG